jgi:putative hydrolase of the HAD superfamily
MPYSVALFDLGGVVIELTGVPRMLEWTGSTMTEAELWSRWLASPCIRRFESGRSTVDEFAREICSEFSLPVATDLFLGEFTRWPKAPYPGAIDLLRGLSARITIASMSNTNELHWERIRDEMRLAELFHFNFPSHLTGCLKPDPEAFEHVVQALGCPAGEILFIDDNILNVESARSVGLDAHHAAGIEAVRDVLRILDTDEHGFRSA